MKEKEISLLCSLYTNGNGAVEKKNLRLQLFNHILSGKANSDEEAAKIIYNSIPDSAFSHLKSRLREDILSVLLLIDNDKITASGLWKAKYQCGKSLLLSEMLMTRGIIDPALNILEEASAVATKFELPVEKILIEDALRNHFIKCNELVTPDKHTMNIFSAVKMTEDILKAKTSYHQILNLPAHSLNGDLSKVEETFLFLKKLQGQVKSARVKFYYYLSAMHYYISRQEAIYAIKSGVELISLVNKNPSLRTSSNMALANSEMAKACLSNYSFSTARGFAKQALRYIPEGMIHQLFALELYFVSLFNENFKDLAYKQLKKAFAHSCFGNSPHCMAKWNFYHAAFHFNDGNFRESLNLLQKSNGVIKNKQFSTGIFLMELMNFAVLRKEKEIGYKLENFRKYLSRQKVQENSRPYAIFEIMKSLTKNKFNFSATVKSENKRMTLLIENKNSYCWNPLSCEIIRFDKWMLLSAEISG